MPVKSPLQQALSCKWQSGFPDPPKSAACISTSYKGAVSDLARLVLPAVKRLVAENQLPHLLFYGPPGTGKTSTVLAIARQIYGNSLHNMTLELNASDDRGIGIVRQEIQDFASTRTIFR